MALNGFGVYSLVIMELIRLSIRCVGVYVVSAYRPGAIPNRDVLKSVARFGAGGLLLSLISTVQQQTPRIAIGYWLGEEALGIFALATRLLRAISGFVLAPLGSVAMSITGRLQDDHETLRALYLQSIQFVSVVAIPCFFGLAAVAPILIPLAIGETWSAAVVPTQILLLLGLRLAMTSNYVAVLRGIGETRSPLIVQLVAAMIVLVGTPLAVPLGLLAVVMVLVTRSLATWPIGAYFLRQKIGIGFADQIKAGMGAAVASAIMALVVSLWIHQTQPFLGDWARMMSGIAIGVVLYSAFLFVFERTLILSVLNRMKSPTQSAQQTG